MPESVVPGSLAGTGRGVLATLGSGADEGTGIGAGMAADGSIGSAGSGGSGWLPGGKGSGAGSPASGGNSGMGKDASGFLDFFPLRRPNGLTSS